MCDGHGLTNVVLRFVARHNPSKLRLGNKVRYYSGNCSSEQAQQHIKQEFISSLNSSGYNVLCRDYPGCGVDNVLVECGEVTREKRDLSQTTTLHRVKRAATHEVAITFDFFIELRDEATANAQQKWKDIDGTLEKMKESTLQSGQLNLSIRDFPMQMKPDSFETVDFEAQLQCPPGSVPRDDSFTCGRSFTIFHVLFHFMFVVVPCLHGICCTVRD